MSTVPETIDAAPVASFQCPKCDMVMIREPDNYYMCYTIECEYHHILWKPKTWELIRDTR